MTHAATHAAAHHSTSAHGSPAAHRRELRLPVKLLVYLVWVGAGYVFWQLGYAALGMGDPQMSVRLFAGWRMAAGLPLLAALSAVTAATATMLLRRWMCDAGTFAVAVGLAALSVRGGTVEYLLIQSGAGGARGGARLPLMFAVELVAWAGLLLIAARVTAMFSRAARGGHEERDASDATSSIPQNPCGAELSVLVRRAGRGGDGTLTPLDRGLRHAAMAAVLTAALIIVFSLDLTRRPVSHGQVLFVSAASAWIATYFAFKQFPVRSALWAMLAALTVALVGYLMATLGSGRADLPMNLPHSPFLRTLPIQAAAAGVGGALLGFWFVFDAAHVATSDKPRSGSEKPASGKKRS
ncbi:MAG: hypothetical protein IT449_01035 [Phycisphaerales bacterium]|nr:hypothetical protein [Phycisphaerales bacterium]